MNDAIERALFNQGSGGVDLYEIDAALLRVIDGGFEDEALNLFGFESIACAISVRLWFSHVILGDGT